MERRLKSRLKGSENFKEKAQAASAKARRYHSLVQESTLLLFGSSAFGCHS